MRRNRKATVLVMVTVLAAGCARSDFRAAQDHAKWRPVTDAAIAKAPEAKPAKVLPQTHMAAGRLFESQGLFDKAILQYRKAVAVNHNYWEAYHRLGLMLSVTGQHEEAVRALTRAVELQPGNALLRNDLGFELLLAKHWVDAERELSKAVELKPTFARAWVNLGMVQSQRGRFDDALASFRRALPEPDAYYNLGLMYRGQRQYASAAKAFSRVLEINPSFSAAQAQLQQLATLPSPVPPQETTPGFAAATHAADPAIEPPARVDTVGKKSVLETADRADEPSAEPEPALPGEEPDGLTAGAHEEAQPFPQASRTDLTSVADAGADVGLWTEDEPCPEEQSGIEEQWLTSRERQIEEEPFPKEQPQVEADQVPGEEEARMKPPTRAEDSTVSRAADEDFTHGTSVTRPSPAQDSEHGEPGAAPPPFEDVTLDLHATTKTDAAGFPTCETDVSANTQAQATPPPSPGSTLDTMARKADAVKKEIACLEEMASRASRITGSRDFAPQAANGELKPAPEIGFWPTSPRTLAEQSVPLAERGTEHPLADTPEKTPGDRRHEARQVMDRKIIPPGSTAETTPRDSRETAMEPGRRTRLAATVIDSPRQRTTTNAADWRAGFKELETWMRMVQEEIACWNEADLLGAQLRPGDTAPRSDTCLCIEEDAICPMAPSDAQEVPDKF